MEVLTILDPVLSTTIELLKAAGEDSKGSSMAFFQFLVENQRGFQCWEMAYIDHIQASLTMLRMISDQWPELSPKLAPFDRFRSALHNFQCKNEVIIAKGKDGAVATEAAVYCERLIQKVSPTLGNKLGFWIAPVVCVFIAAATTAIGIFNRRPTPSPVPSNSSESKKNPKTFSISFNISLGV